MGNSTGNLPKVVICSAKRTPIIPFHDESCGKISAVQLGIRVAQAVTECLEGRKNLVDRVYVGNVCMTGLRQNPPKQIALGAGCPPTTRALTIGNVCGSGLSAVIEAAQAIICSSVCSSLQPYSDIVKVAAVIGTENMRDVPCFIQMREGFRGVGNPPQVKDTLFEDGLRDAYGERRSMGEIAADFAEAWGFTKEAMNAWAKRSFRNALEATETGALKDEIVAVEVPGRKRGSTTIIHRDGGPFTLNIDEIDGLNPAFGNNITKAACSQMGAGAAGVLVADGETAESLELSPLAEIVDYCTVGVESDEFPGAPIGAIKKLLENSGIPIADILFEINEAFSAVPMAVAEELGIPEDQINVNGGAAALGHPLGASGTRILVTLIHAMRKRGYKYGIAALCVGGGESVAMLVKLTE